MNLIKSLTLAAGSIFLFAVQLRAGLPPRTLAAFGPSYQQTSLLQASDGNLYGLSALSGDYGLGSIYKVTPGGKITVLTSFSSLSPAGEAFGNLILGADGNLYGTGTAGTNGGTALFRATLSGSSNTLISFDPANRITTGLLMQGVDSNFYGVSPLGGSNGTGNIYQVTTNGSVTILHTFNSGGSDGGNPETPLVQATNGNFYGTTASGGASLANAGTFFLVTSNGQFATLISFAGTNGSQPSGNLALGADGNVYGTTISGGTSNSGVAFRVTPGGVLTVLTNFIGDNGSTPWSGLVRGLDNNFYGTTLYGGDSDDGTVFRLTPAGIITTLHSFNGKDGVGPNTLARGQDGNFYGTTLSTVFRLSPTGALTTMVRPSFSGSQQLIHATDGAFYGTTMAGGDFGVGTAFRLSPAGILTKLASFGGDDGASVPSGSFIEARNGQLYGTATGGGTNGGGSIYRMTRSGQLRTMVAFNATPGANQPGSNPSSLMQAANSQFYGTTFLGGSPADGNINGYGTVFRMAPSGKVTVLASFNGTNGANPKSLIQAKDHNFYGVTMSMAVGSGSPTVFKMTPAGTLSTIFTFDGTNHFTPQFLLQGKDRNFYGTTSGNGSNISGTVFSLTEAGVITYLVQFDATNGFYPTDLIQGTDGNFYCAAQFDGTTNLSKGAVFQITPSGTVFRVVTFNGADGSNPAQLALQPGGRLFGVTASGGAKGGGTIFEVGRASYAGLFYDTNSADPISSGFFRLTISLDFKFTGTVKIAGRTHYVRGQFDVETLSSTARVRRPGRSTITLAMQLSPDGNSLTGTAGTPAWSVPLLAESASDYDAGNPSPDAGQYNFILSGANGGGRGHASVSAAGTAMLAGVLGDHAAVSQQTFIDTGEQWPFYCSLYHGKGVLTGWLSFTNQPANEFNGNLIWSKAPHATAGDPTGFTSTMVLQGLPR